MNPTGNSILITGGGTGIGRGLAEAFHRDGNRVILAGRRRSVLEDTVRANPGMRFITVDVENLGDTERFGAEVKAEFPALNVLINNAGIMKSENLRSGVEDLAIAEQTVAINLLGTFRITATLLPFLLGQPKASIMTVSSGLAFLPIHPNPIILRYQGRHSLLDAVTPLSTARRLCGSTGDRPALCSNRTHRTFSGRRSECHAAGRLHTRNCGIAQESTTERRNLRRARPLSPLCRTKRQLRSVLRGMERLRSQACCRTRRQGLLNLLTTACNEDLGPFLDEELCGCQPDPGSALSNHCYFSLQLFSFSHR